jgi:hypothetical protein
MKSLLTSQPADAMEAAKLCVWSFVAGFGERLVPNTIDRIAADTPR